MRLLLCLCLGLACNSGADAQASTEGHPVDLCAMVWSGQGRYGINNFRTVLRMAERGGSDTFTDAAVRSAGDAVSVATLKIVDEQELLSPVFIRAYLRLARTAFSRPEFIACADDRSPEVTLFVLDYLREKVQDKELQAQIDSTKEYVLKQAGPPKQSPIQVSPQPAK